jgi:hypothetical protein
MLLEEGEIYDTSVGASRQISRKNVSEFQRFG